MGTHWLLSTSELVTHTHLRELICELTHLLRLLSIWSLSHLLVLLAIPHPRLHTRLLLPASTRIPTSSLLPRREKARLWRPILRQSRRKELCSASTNSTSKARCRFVIRKGLLLVVVCLSLVDGVLTTSARSCSDGRLLLLLLLLVSVWVFKAESWVQIAVHVRWFPLAPPGSGFYTPVSPISPFSWH